MKILITGINGMLGQQVYQYLAINSNYKIYGAGKSEQHFSDLVTYFQGDLSKPEFLEEISSINYDFIVHCAALVNLDTCEQNYEVAEAIHVTASKNLALANPNSNIIYISTDSVFNGDPIDRDESAEPAPLNNYALTKYLGEREMAKNHNKLYTIRLNIYGFKMPFSASLFEWAYSNLKNGKSINGYDNIIFNPLYSGQIAKVLGRFITDRPDFGIYNLGCSEKISKFDFILKVANTFGFNSSLISRVSANFEKTAIKRPYYTVLSTEKINSTFPDLDLSLENGFGLLKQDLLKLK